MKTKKTLAILLAVMMILSALPVVSLAADPIALTEDNVTTHPQAINSIVYGQKNKEVEFTDGVVEYNGVVVPGTWTYAEPDKNYVGVSTGARLKLIFTPEDETTYSGFTTSGRNTQFTVAKSDLILVDPENDPPVTTGAVASGTNIIDIAITGGAVVNKVSSEATANRSIKDWTWEDTALIITESGYYNAIRKGGKYYNTLTVPVYIEVDQSTIVKPTIYGSVTTWPTIECPEWTPGMTVADLVLTGGEATVEGTFAIATAATTVIKPDEDNRIRITFTPEDPEVVMTSDTYKFIVISPALIREDITATVDPDYVCTFEYGTKSLRGAISGDASTYGITTNVDADVTKAKASVASVFDANGNEVDETDRYLAPGKYTAKVFVSAETINITGIGLVQLYKSTYVDIPVVITKKASTEPFGSLNITGTTEEEGKATAGIYYKYDSTEGVNGYCILKINGETVVDNIAPAAMVYDFSTKTSGKFTATLEYIPAETDYIEFETTVLTQEFELEVLEPEIPVIPGGDNDGGITLPDLDLDTDGSHKFSFVNIIKNLVEALKAFIQQIGDFFSNMSLEGLGNIMG